MRGRSWVLAVCLAAAGCGSVRAADERPRPLPGARVAAAAPTGGATEGPLDYDPWQGVNRKIFTFNDKLD